MRKPIMVVSILLLITVGMLWRLKTGEREISADITPSSSDDVKPAMSRSLEYVQMTFLDIGQGDATFIEWPDGTQMLVDCAKDARVLEALGRVMDFYDKQIDYLVVTHPDLDHYGGCTDVLKRFAINNIVYSGARKESDEQWQYFWRTAQAEGAAYQEITKQQTWEMASATLRFLYPDHDVRENQTVPGFAKGGSDNNGSIVVKLSFGESDVLLTGDAEKELEQYLVNNYSDILDAEVLKVSHHGSGGSSIKPFLDAVTPAYAIISAGKDNSYGHPSRRVLKRLERASSTIWRTDWHGDVKLRLYRDNISVIE